MNTVETKTAILAFLNGYGDITRAVRECYASADWTGVNDALGFFSITKRSSDSDRARVASLRAIMHRVGREEDGRAVVTICKSKDGKLICGPNKARKASVLAPNFIAAHKAVTTAIEHLSKLQTVEGFAAFHSATLNAMQHLSALGDWTQESVTVVTKVSSDSVTEAE